ncbi:vacuolar ATP synthase subunit H [Eremomyces bilateralis CBS 781.70]|uniref:V-type proton ATPase subunit H n=1 Tax=Eremomyces bilateralis CBS 781.70 TaxID=1392243 RepID=A0A6G1GGD0_9PEZI|nr:vacuolar ATP synthase subunit H [Eremomyces bilateralis CBS 781.70]KAF1816986.1 vacuolar ATP synthase subunit H [Eremomyces bilateralis CBS 781.70]
MADPAAYILSLQNNIRQRPISWEGAVRAKTISDADLKAIKSIDKVRTEQRKETIESDSKTYCSLLLGGGGQRSIFESAAKRQDIIQYMLVLAGDVLEDVPEFAETLIKHPDPYAHLLPFLKQPSNLEEPIALLASTLITRLLSPAIDTKGAPKVSETLPVVYKYLSSLSKTSDAGLQDIAVQHYTNLLKNTASRKIFWDLRSETVAPLFEILKTAGGAASKDSSSILSTPTAASVGGVSLQLLYHVLFVIWKLSFDGETLGDGLDDEYDLIPLYVSLVRISPKEKTTRLLLATLVNLLNSNPASLLPAAALAHLHPAVKSVQSRHLTDPELLDDLATLLTLLEDHAKSQTTFDLYAAEVRGGHLRWSPPHRSAMFWAENARRVLEENRGELPQQLAEILGRDWEGDTQVLAIGCNDVACLVKEVPEARSKLERWGLKGRVMALMEHRDGLVRSESLRALGEWFRYTGTLN